MHRCLLPGYDAQTYRGAFWAPVCAITPVVKSGRADLKPGTYATGTSHPSVAVTGLSFRPAFNAYRPLTGEPRLHLLEKRPVQVRIAQRPLARGAHPALSRSEKDSALVALPL